MWILSFIVATGIVCELLEVMTQMHCMFDSRYVLQNTMSLWIETVAIDMYLHLQFSNPLCFSSICTNLFWLVAPTLLASVTFDSICIFECD